MNRHQRRAAERTQRKAPPAAVTAEPAPTGFVDFRHENGTTERMPWWAKGVIPPETRTTGAKP